MKTKSLVEVRENSIILRILKICSGNPGSMTVFIHVLHATDLVTLEKIISIAEEEKWTSLTAWEIFKASDQNIDMFIKRYK